VRCAGCEAEPLTSAQYCECCGSRFSLHETKAFETAPVTGPDHWAQDGSPASDARCERCGGPIADGDFCRPCQRAFGSWVGSAEPAAPVGDAATALAEAAAVEESLWSQLMKSPAPQAMDSFDTATPAVSLSEFPEATMTSVDDKVAVAKAEVVRVNEARAESVRTEMVGAEAATTQAALPQGAETEAARAPKAPKPAVVNKRPNVPVPSQHRRHRIALAAAAVVVAAIGVGAYWLRIHEQPVIAREEQQKLVAKDVRVAERQPSASRLSAAATTATTGRTSAAAPPQAPASARPKPTAPAPPQIASVSVPKPATEAPAPAAAPPAPDVVATASSPVPPAPPLGPFFETTDVNELPRVATRVEPQLPDELRARPLNEIVIVRVLVSQSGHPSRISLLRRSKTGLRLDNAVIAAVNQWTFSPGRKRGEAVSCWFNFGVPVGRPD
jgi:TonB family protein